MEEEDEQEDQDQEEVEAEQQPHSPSDLGGVPWKEAVELHAKLKGQPDDEGEGDALDEEEEEDEEEDEEEEEEDEESSDGNFVFHCWFEHRSCGDYKCSLFPF